MVNDRHRTRKVASWQKEGQDNVKIGKNIKVLTKWEAQKVKVRDKEDGEDKQTKIPKMQN